MAGFYLWYRELADRRVNVPLERGRLLVTMLFASGIPTFIDIGLRTFFKGLCLLRSNSRLLLLTGRALFLDEVDTGANLQPNCIAGKASLLQ